MRVGVLLLGDMLIFIACCQQHQHQLGGIVRGREKNSVATVGVFACGGVYKC